MRPIERRAVLLFGDLLDGLPESQPTIDYYYGLCRLAGRPVLQWSELTGQGFEDRTICALCAEGSWTEDGGMRISGDVEYAWDCITDVAGMLDMPLEESFAMFRYDLPAGGMEKLANLVSSCNGKGR